MAISFLGKGSINPFISPLGTPLLLARIRVVFAAFVTRLITSVEQVRVVVQGIRPD